MSQSAPPERGRRAAGIVILGMLAMQCIAGFLPVLIPALQIDPKMWPFLKYGMYVKPHYEGEIADRWLVVLELDDGSEVEMKASDLEMHQHLFSAVYWAIKNDDMSRVREFVADYEKRFGGKGTKIRLDSIPYSISKDGVKYHPQKVLKSIDLEP